MKYRVALLLALSFLTVACSAEEKVVPSTPNAILDSTASPTLFLEDLTEALSVVAGLNQATASLQGETVVIVYEMVSGDTQPEVLLQEWLDIATLTLIYLEQPYDIELVTQVQGQPFAQLTARATDLAAFLVGEMSLEQLLSRVEVRDLL